MRTFQKRRPMSFTSSWQRGTVGPGGRRALAYLTPVWPARLLTSLKMRESRYACKCLLLRIGRDTGKSAEPARGKRGWSGRRFRSCPRRREASPPPRSEPTLTADWFVQGEAAVRSLGWATSSPPDTRGRPETHTHTHTRTHARPQHRRGVENATPLTSVPLAPRSRTGKRGCIHRKAALSLIVNVCGVWGGAHVCGPRWTPAGRTLVLDVAVPLVVPAGPQGASGMPLGPETGEPRVWASPAGEAGPRRSPSTRTPALPLPEASAQPSTPAAHVQPSAPQPSTQAKSPSSGIQQKLPRLHTSSVTWTRRTNAPKAQFPHVHSHEAAESGNRGNRGHVTGVAHGGTALFLSLPFQFRRALPEGLLCARHSAKHGGAQIRRTRVLMITGAVCWAPTTGRVPS